MNERHTTDFTFTPRSPRQPSRRAAGRSLSSCAPWWPEWRHCSAAPWCVSVALGSRTPWLLFTSEVGAGSDVTPDLTPFQCIQLTSGLVRLFRLSELRFRLQAGGAALKRPTSGRKGESRLPRTTGTHRYTTGERRNNGGPREECSRVAPRSCQRFPTNTFPGKDFDPSLHTSRGHWRSHDPLGCHRRRENPTTSTTAELPASIAVLMTASSADTLLVMSPVTTSHPSWGGSVT